MNEIEKQANKIIKEQRHRHIVELERRATLILELKAAHGERRPVVIEFCGSPKSGKTTSITSLNFFLKRNGFRTKILTERASVCPIDSKTNPMFNLWTMCSSLAELVEHLSYGKDRYDVIIADRGLFDALTWFYWLTRHPLAGNPYLDQPSYEYLVDFITMPLLTKVFDLIFVFKSSPETSLFREYTNQLTEKQGSIMNEPVLASYEEAVDHVVGQYGPLYRNVKTVDSTDRSADEVGFEVVTATLDCLQSLFVEKIGYLPESVTKRLLDGVSYGIDTLRSVKMVFGDRAKVELSSVVQPVPIAVITNEDRTKVLVVEKNSTRTGGQSPESSRALLYIGGHVRLEDENPDGSEDFFQTVENALHREIEEEIGEAIHVATAKPFLIYSHRTERSNHHLAICYVITMELEGKNFEMNNYEFAATDRKSKSGELVPISEVVSMHQDFEEWSVAILAEVFHTAPVGREVLFPATPGQAVKK